MQNTVQTFYGHWKGSSRSPETWYFIPAPASHDVRSARPPIPDSEFEQFQTEIEQARDAEIRRHPERVDEIRERFAAKLDLVAEWREIERKQIA